MKYVDIALSIMTAIIIFFGAKMVFNAGVREACQAIICSCADAQICQMYEHDKKAYCSE